MHEYITKLDRNKLLFWLAFLSIVIASFVTTFIDKLVMQYDLQRMSQLANILGFTFSAPVIYGILYFLISHCLWKTKLIQKITKIPDLSGKWNSVGEGRKYEKNDINCWNGTIEIQQTMDRILITLKTKNSSSSSKSLLAGLNVVSPTEYELSYRYENEPYLANQDLHQHTGFCLLRFDLIQNTAIGIYFTDKDRCSFGTMKLIRS